MFIVIYYQYMLYLYTYFMEISGSHKISQAKSGPMLNKQTNKINNNNI